MQAVWDEAEQSMFQPRMAASIVREWQQRVKHAIWVSSVLVSWKDYECRYIFSILVSDTSFKLIIVNCEWSQWSQFATCSVTCGGGTEERSRTISVPAQNGGTECAGNDTESQECNTDACPGEKQTYFGLWTQSARLSRLQSLSSVQTPFTHKHVEILFFKFLFSFIFSPRAKRGG